MQKLLPAAVIVLVMLAFSLEAPSNAQSAKPDSDSLTEKSAAIRDAWLNGTPEDFFEMLAPWIQGRVELFREKLNAAIDKKLGDIPYEEEDGWEQKWVDEIVGEMQEADPNSIFNVKTLEDVKKLTAAQLLVLVTEQLQLQAEEDDARRSAEWHEVDRRVYEVGEEHPWRDEVNQTYGDVTFMNRFDDIFLVTCAWDGGDWQVVHVAADAGGPDFGIGWVDDPMTSNPVEAYRDTDLRDARRSEGEQMLGSMKGQTRVAFSKTGLPPKTLTDAGVWEGEREGKYFRVWDEVYSNAGKDRGALITESIDNDDGWGVLYFEYAGGDGEMKWYNSKKALDDALEAFETAE